MRGFGTKVEYALLAALDLAEHYAPESPVKVRQIAHRIGAPPRYLEQILLELKTAALVKSRRGPAGGFWLMRRPERIDLAEIVKAVEGDGTDPDGSPVQKGRAVVRELGRYLARNRYRALSQISLATFLKRARELARR